MHGHRKNRVGQKPASAAHRSASTKKLHTKSRAKSTKASKPLAQAVKVTSTPQLVGIPHAPLFPSTNPLTTQSHAFFMTKNKTPTLPNHSPEQPQHQQEIFQQQSTPLITTTRRRFQTLRFQPSKVDSFSMSMNGISANIRTILQSILPTTLQSYGQTDKIRKKKSNPSGGDDSGPSGGSGGDDSGDSDDEENKKKKTKSKETPKETPKDDVTPAKKHEEDENKAEESQQSKKVKKSTEENSSDTKQSETTKKNKFTDSSTLGSIFNLTKAEIEKYSKSDDGDDDKDAKDEKQTTSTEKKKKKSKKDESGDDSDDEKKKKDKKKKKKSSDDNDDGDGKDEKDKKKKDGDDDEESNTLSKLFKGSNFDDDKKKGGKKGDEDENEGPTLTPKMKKALNIYRHVFHGTVGLVGAGAIVGMFHQARLLTKSATGSYDEFRQYLSSGLLETLQVYPEANLVRAKFKTSLPESTTGAPQAIIPPGFPEDYAFKVLDLSVLSRQLSSDVARFGIPDVNIVSSTFFGLGSGLEALAWVTLFYMLSRKAINSELGWFYDKPASNMFNVRGMRGLMDRAKVWKMVKDVPTRFKDVAGMDESKQEIVEFVDFLKNPDKYHSLGAKLPKGALLHGPPGTGKTLLAKAVAGEAGVPFITTSGSEFVQTYVGMGAKRVRELFAQARKNAPCIIFIDEVDAIARKRDSAGNHDEKEATLNQLLVEMDGFSQNEKIIVLAATNRIDMLDKAFVRPGRIDRKILVDTPDLNGRKEVFKVHLKKVVHNFNEDELGAKLAALTPGLSGADISNICNEAAIYAAREAKETIELVDFEQAIDRVIAGLKKKGLLKESDADRKLVAYHESGHAVAGWFLEHADPLLKVTITPRTNGALGFAQYMPKQSGIRRTEELYDRLCVALGGRAAEEIFFQKVSTGASDDLRKVTNLAQSMVVEWGMSPKLPNMVFPDSGRLTKPMSDRTSEIIDEEVVRIVHSQYDRVKDLLVQNKAKLEILSETLLKEETINHDTIVRVLGPRPFQNDEYLEFIKQSKKELTPEEKAILGPTESDTKDKKATTDEKKGDGETPAAPTQGSDDKKTEEVKKD